MARKKKTYKDSPASDACSGDSFQSLAAASAAAPSLQRSSGDLFHTSDSELLDLKQKSQLQKNKSNLFLIKSYSFIDRTNTRKPKSLNIPQKLQDFEEYHHSLLREETDDAMAAKEKKHKVKEKEKDKDKDKDKTSKKPKKAKLKKSKSTYDSSEDLEEFQDILRRPSVILEHQVSDSRKRPLTFTPETKTHKPVVKSKTMEDIEMSPHIKRESFIRHSLQSIRRSFSKKHQISSSSQSSGQNTSACTSACSSNSSSSSTSSSSDNSNSLKKSKLKTKDKEKEKTKTVEHVEEEEEEEVEQKEASQANLPNGPEQNHLMEIPTTATCLENTSSSSSSSAVAAAAYQLSSSVSSSSSAGSATAALAVLPEEDEKDLLNPSERSTSSVSTLGQLPADSFALSMAPLQTHTETQSVQCLNTSSYDIRDTGKSSSSSPPQLTRSKRVLQHQISIPESIETTSIGCATSSEYSSASLVESAKSVFQPRNEQDINSFENYIFNNYITDMELEEEDEYSDQVNGVNMNLSPQDSVYMNKNNRSGGNQFPSPPPLTLEGQQYTSTPHRPNANRGSGGSNEKKFKRISMIELPPKGILTAEQEDKDKPNLQRFMSMQSLKHSSTSLAPLQAVPSSSSLRSISPSRRSASSNSSSTAKHEHSPAAATAAAGAATTSTGSTSNTTPPEKEKKRKEVSSSRVKKFHRHFSQVSKDEKLINYFSCALVSDILLQGHLYITDQHFAFYSNVFGYVTKVVIPTSSVTKISKEKTAKIIPNAVGVATADERHVFGSFISREAAFRLMCSVCPPLGVAEILPKDPAGIEISEEYSVEDDSSCSISGNESPANANSTNENHHSEPSQTILRRSVAASTLSIAEAEKHRHSDIPLNAKTAANATAALHLRASAPPGASSMHYVNGGGGVCGPAGVGGGGIGHVIVSSINSPATAIGCATLGGGNLTFIAGSASTTTSATTTPTPSTSSSPTTVMALPHTKAYQILNKFRTLSDKLMVNLKFPTEIHVVYLGVMLTALLAVFTIFLLYRILDIEAKTNVYRSPIEFNWQSGNDDDIFAEALRFQKQLQLKSTEEAQNILKTNLEQIAKVRRSLETLSMLIHDRSSSFGSTHPDDSD